MNPIQQQIEKNEREFEEKFPATHSIYPSDKKGFLIISEYSVPVGDLKSHLHSSQLAIIKAVVEELTGKREELSEIEHDQWIAWSKNIAETEQITPARLERWQKLWRPYSELTEAEKDQDREWSDKVLDSLITRLNELLK